MRDEEAEVDAGRQSVPYSKLEPSGLAAQCRFIDDFDSRLAAMHVAQVVTIAGVYGGMTRGIIGFDHCDFQEEQGASQG